MHRCLASLFTVATSLRFRKRAFLLCCFAVLLAVLPFASVPTSTGAEDATVRGDDHFGINWINPPDTPASDTRMAQAVASGTSWDRFPFYWYDVQSTSGGSYTYTKLDKSVDVDVAKGLKVLGVLMGAPQWATTGGTIDLTAWQKYVAQTVTHFKGRVSAWEIWNEPDLLGTNGGVFWQWSASDYYQLLKVTYSTIKSIDPDAKVLMGSLASPENNRAFFTTLLDSIAADSTASKNNYYCDALSVHLYSRTEASYDYPTGFVGTPEFAGYHNLMAARGFDKPIWITETGVGIWDTGTGEKGSGRATMSENASYLIQAYSLALAAGVEKIFFFQFYDDGATSVNQDVQNRKEYYGLISNAGEVRSGYKAYQTAVKYFSNPQLITRVNLGRDGSADVKGIDIVTMYGTPNGKVTVLWNNDGTSNEQVNITASSSKATLADKLGNEKTVTPTNGVYTITLAQATDNNNPNSRPNDFIVGGDPVILVESTYQLPGAFVKPMSIGVKAPFTVTWGTTQSVSGSVTYDVQYMDEADGIWRSWINGTAATSAQFGTSGAYAQLNHTYLFRVRARDADGNLLGGMDFPANGTASTVVLGGDVVSSLPSVPAAASSITTKPTVDAKIEVVWPQGGVDVTKATKANIGAYLFGKGTRTSVNSSFDLPVKLYGSVNNGVEEELAVGKKTIITSGSLKFPSWQFNDVDVSKAQDANNKYFFRVAVEGQTNLGNIWAHGTNALTIFPQSDVPTGVLRSAPAIIDGKVEIVWPQDNLPVEKATKANIGVYLFGHGSLNSVPASYDRPVKLLRTLNNGLEEEVAVGVKTMKTVNGITFPTWQFNDVDVSAARDGSTQYYFRVSVDGVRTFGNVWSHGKDSRTNYPTTDVPDGVLP